MLDAETHPWQPRSIELDNPKCGASKLTTKSQTVVVNIVHEPFLVNPSIPISSNSHDYEGRADQVCITYRQLFDAQDQMSQTDQASLPNVGVVSTSEVVVVASEVRTLQFCCVSVSQTTQSIFKHLMRGFETRENRK